MSESKLELRQVDTNQQAVVLPKNYDVRLYFEQDRTHNGYVCGKPKDLHALADWIKENVPLSLADTRDRDEDMRKLAKAFFAKLAKFEGYRTVIGVDMDHADIAGAIGGVWDHMKTQDDVDDGRRYLKGLYNDLPAWLQQHYGEAS